MQKNKMAGDSIVYNTLLDGCTRHGRRDLCEMVLEDMEKSAVVPSNFTLGILVKMYGRQHELEKAFKVVNEWPRRHGFAANAQVKTCLMGACVNNGAVDRAVQVFEDLQATGCADAKAYGALILGCARNGFLDKAIELVEEAYGLCPERGTVASSYGRNGVMDQEPVDQLMRALVARGQGQEKAVPLLERLRAAKAPISSKVFASACGTSKELGPAKGGGKGKAPWRRGT
jgi:pentatricopeptide repeat protein